MKNAVAFKSLHKNESCEIKDGSQAMVLMLMLI